jgi:PhzF family phenazine biosynthesis protein
MKIKVFTLNSFAKTIDGGNPAGVVLNADGLSEKEMVLIAKKVALSETAFITRSSKADFKVRFFTPTDEVDLCGHATIATYSLMHTLGKIKAGNYTQETKAGILGIKIHEDGTIFMNQTLP